MKIQNLLDHHGIAGNPFADEDAQTDLVFKEHCIGETYHPSWDKVYGDPAEPATAIVFGEKGSGKTAMRLQIARHLQQYNCEHPQQRLYVVEYDDFNPFLDRFRDKLPSANESTRKTSRSSTGTRPATCCCWPPATTNRPPKRSRAAGIGCAAGFGSGRSRRIGNSRWGSPPRWGWSRW